MISTSLFMAILVVLVILMVSVVLFWWIPEVGKRNVKDLVEKKRAIRIDDARVNRHARKRINNARAAKQNRHSHTKEDIQQN